MGRHAEHGHWVGGKPSPTYVSWQAMLARCTYPRSRSFARYGGAGIGVCDSWRSSFDAFLADMGPRPAGRTLDRANNAEGYGPDNCRWATTAEQAANRSSTTRPEVVQAVRELCAAGWRKEDVADAFGVSLRTAFRIAASA